MNRCLLLAALLLPFLASAPAAAQNGEDAPRQERRFAGERASDSLRSDTTFAYSDTDWTPFFEHAGVAFSIIHYRHAAGGNGGVVLRLINENDYAVRYRLRLGFLSSKADTEEADAEEADTEEADTEEADAEAADAWRSGHAQGVLKAGQMKTGSSAGLFWVPFEGGTSIAEIRLPEYDITRVE